MISDPMNRKIPTIERVDPRAVVDRRRMLVRVAAVMRGAAWPIGSACALIRLSSETTCSTGSAGLAAQALDQVAAQPAGAGARERRDDDLVDPLVVGRLHRGRERIRVDDLPVGVDPLRAELRERAPKAAGGLGARDVARLRRDDQEARRALRGPRADVVEQLLRDHGLVRDDEDVRARPWRRRPATTWRTGMSPAALRDVADDVAAHPARALLGMRRDDDLGRRRLELDERVLRRLHRARLDDEALRRNRPSCAAAPASCRAGGPPRRGACPGRRRSRGAAR